MNKGVPGIIGMSGARWNLVWNDFIKNLSLEQYFEGELQHDLSGGRDFARWGKHHVSGDSQPEEDETQRQGSSPGLIICGCHCPGLLEWPSLLAAQSH